LLDDCEGVCAAAEVFWEGAAGAFGEAMMMAAGLGFREAAYTRRIHVAVA
jgi:hypothetical protein